ncbi:MAG: alpha/beta hydrolase [Gammaproteobacteria bacterium]|nr:alpha/beta hydrolase [Gammaproteobacteria bacterium]
MNRRPITCTCRMMAVAIVIAAATIGANDIREDIVYVEKEGVGVTYDVVPAAEPNGAAVLLMSSGGWFSRKWPVDQVKQRFGFLLDAGYTVVPVRHRSAPEFKVPDAVADVQHAVRHVRHHAANYGIDASRMAVMGFSSGGHLTLMISLDSDDGSSAETDDAVANTPNHVAAGIAYFPPVDLENSVGPNERFPALEFDPSLATSVSPINFADAEDPPILFLHGTEDQLVPLHNSTRMHEALTNVGVESKLSVFEGEAHGFRDPSHQERARTEILAFLASHLITN